MCLNVPKVQSHFLVCIVLFLCLGCNSRNGNDSQAVESVSNPVVDSESSAVVQQAVVQKITWNTDSLAFEMRIDSLAAFFLTLGFKREADVKLRSPNEYMRHWWLKKYSRSTIGKTSEYPSEEDLGRIISIKQAVFKKVWEYKVEQWGFEGEAAAQRWYNLAKHAKGSSGSYYLEKPPNDFWLEGNKLYIVMSTTAVDWFEYSDQVIETFSGMTRVEIQEGRK